ELDERSKRRLLNACHTGASRGTETDRNRDRLFIVKQQRRHGRSMSEAISASYARRRFDRIAEVTESLDVSSDGPGAYFETGRQALPRPVAARLQHCKQLKQARRCLPHSWPFPSARAAPLELLPSSL